MDQETRAEADAAANITRVTTARQLQAAVEAGAQDILIREHLDLNGIPLGRNGDRKIDDVDYAPVLGTMKPTTRSIRVRLTLQLASTQCRLCFGES